MNFCPARHSVSRGEPTSEAPSLSPCPVPLYIRNAPTSLMKGLRYGKGYKYAHDFEEQTAPMDFLPEALAGRRFYEPGTSGHEREIGERLATLRQAREAIKKK
ncbi:MAG: hypothetical protein ABI718_09165 [Acidobacteriota bacterium]